MKAGGEGDDRGWDGWMVSPTQWTWVWINSRNCWWTGRPCCRPRGHNESDTTEGMNWTEWNLIKLWAFFFFFSSFTFFIVVRNLCLYVGLLQFGRVFLFLFFFFNYNFLNLFFHTFIPLFAFPTVIFPLQLIFNIYKSSLSTSI